MALFWLMVSDPPSLARATTTGLLNCIITCNAVQCTLEHFKFVNIFFSYSHVKSFVGSIFTLTKNL